MARLNKICLILTLNSFQQVQQNLSSSWSQFDNNQQDKWAMENFYHQLRVSEIGIHIYRLIKRKIGLHQEWMKLIACILNQWCPISELIKHLIINQELKIVSNLCSKNTIPSITSTQIPKISSKFIILLMSEWNEATIQLVLWTILVTFYQPKKVLPKLKRKEFLKITFSIEINLLRILMNLKHKP